MTIAGSRQDSNLLKAGPAVSVTIEPSTPVLLSRQKSGTATSPVRALALIDTGASITCIDESIVKSLRLTHRDTARILTPSGESIHNLYDVRLTVSQLVTRELPVVEANMSNQQHKVLIGRDILAIGTLIYSGWTNSFEFCV